MKDDADEGNARRVIHFIRDHPGCHLRRIRNELGISMGTVQYHLARLEKAGRIASNRHGLFRYYFPIGVFQDNEKNLLEILSQETARDILIFIIEQKNPTQTDIVARIGVSAASVSWHLNRLTELGVITEVKEGKYKRYQLNGDPGRVGDRDTELRGVVVGRAAQRVRDRDRHHRQKQRRQQRAQQQRAIQPQFQPLLP